MYMTDEREEGIKNDLLWDYQQAEIKLKAFRVQFRDAADSYTILAKLFRSDPESFAPDLSVMSEELQRLAGMAKEYKELLYKNAERKASLIKMKAI
jgi:hypothetical protein